MFGNKQTKEVEKRDYKKELTDSDHAHKLEIKGIESDHKLALKEKEFELKHFKDDEVKKLQDELSEAKQENAVLVKENEMLDKITNLNADIIDIKDLVSNLIGKLPEVKLTNLTLGGNGKKSNE